MDPLPTVTEMPQNEGDTPDELQRYQDYISELVQCTYDFLRARVTIDTVGIAGYSENADTQLYQKALHGDIEAAKQELYEFYHAEGIEEAYELIDMLVFLTASLLGRTRFDERDIIDAMRNNILLNHLGSISNKKVLAAFLWHKLSKIEKLDIGARCTRDKEISAVNLFAGVYLLTFLYLDGLGIDVNEYIRQVFEKIEFNYPEVFFWPREDLNMFADYEEIIQFLRAIRHLPKDDPYSLVKFHELGFHLCQGRIVAAHEEHIPLKEWIQQAIKHLEAIGVDKDMSDGDSIQFVQIISRLNDLINRVTHATKRRGGHDNANPFATRRVPTASTC